MASCNPSHALPRRRTHPPSHISSLLRRSLRLDHLAVTTFCSAPSSPLVGGCGRAGEASFFQAECFQAQGGPRVGKVLAMAIVPAIKTAELRDDRPRPGGTGTVGPKTSASNPEGFEVHMAHCSHGGEGS